MLLPGIQSHKGKKKAKDFGNDIKSHLSYCETLFMKSSM